MASFDLQRLVTDEVSRVDDLPSPVGPALCALRDERRFAKTPLVSVHAQ
jgi:hypothetical protein